MVRDRCWWNICRIILRKNIIDLREICYEEPEMCLHPQLQYQMARLIIRMVNSKINIVASTHSDIVVMTDGDEAILEKDRTGKDGKLKICKDKYMKVDCKNRLLEKKKYRRVSGDGE